MHRSAVLYFSRITFLHHHSGKARIGRSVTKKFGLNLTFTERFYATKSLKLMRPFVRHSSFVSSWQQVKNSLQRWIGFKQVEKLHDPVPLPQTLTEISKLEYNAVKVKGQFDHSREILVGPCMRLDVFGPNSSPFRDCDDVGFCVYTPFKPVDRDYEILVNRGWVPPYLKNPELRKEGQIEGETELVAIVHLNEGKRKFDIKNEPEQGFWFYRDLARMSSYAKTAPICIDAVKSSDVPGGPIGGQTYVPPDETGINGFRELPLHSFVFYRKAAGGMPASMSVANGYDVRDLEYD